MSSLVEQQPDAWQQHAIFTELLQAPAAKQALLDLEQHLKPIFNSHAYYSLQTGMLTVKLQTLTSLLTTTNLLPQLTPHDFKLGLHLAITPTLSQSASPSKEKPLHYDDFLNAAAFCAYFYPAGKDPLQTPSPRLPDASVGLDVALTNLRHRLVAAADSPRSINVKLASPATTQAFATPRTSFPAPSPTTSVVSQSPGPEQWFTPAQSAVRTKLFPISESDSSVICHQDPDDDANMHPTVSSVLNQNDSVPESATKSNSSIASLDENDGIDSTPQLSEEEQDFASLTQSCTHAEKLWHPSNIEEDPLENVQISSRSPTQSEIKDEEIPQEIPQQEINIDPELEVTESADGQTISKHTATTPVAVAIAPLDQLTLAAAAEDVVTEEPQGTPMKPTESPKSDAPETAPTNVSLAPSTALSHLPSPELGFESPELTGAPCSPYNASSVEPMSSRKLSFSDSDEASDSSSCYENASDNEDTVMRIENAFENSHPIADCDDNDASPDILSSYSQLPSNHEEDDTIIIQPTMNGEITSIHNLADTERKSPSEGNSHVEMDRGLQAPAHDFSDSRIVSSERDVFDSEVAIVPEALSGVNENEPTVALEATHDISLSEPKIALGLPAEAFSEAAAAALHTPIAPATSTRFPDTDIEDMDEEAEEHTLLFDNGYASDGSELSMRTRETMSRMVEDYLSLHGSTPQQDLGEEYYAEEQVLMTPDRKSEAMFEDKGAVENHVIVEEGPCVSEKAESKQSRITHVMQESIQDFGNVGDGDEWGFKLERPPVEPEEADDEMSPLLFSEKASSSSEISPDGLNLIKKQLVLPSPFGFSDSPVGSSMSSGASGGSFEKKDAVNCPGETEKEEQQALVTVPVKQENEIAGAVICHQQGGNGEMREADMMHVMRETLETCRILREEVAKRQETPQERSQQQQYQRDFGRWIEFGIFGLIVVIATLVLVERRLQRGVFLDVLV